MQPNVSPFTVLTIPPFRWYFICYLLYRVAAEMQVVAVIWHLYQLTGSALSLGMVGLARFIPVILGAIPAGYLADHYNRRTIIVSSQILMTIVSFSLLTVTAAGTVTPGFIYLLIALSSLATTIDTPARQSLVPHLVPAHFLSRAISLSTILWQSAVVIGPAIAGFSLGLVGLQTTYLFASVSFGASIGFLYFLPYAHTAREKPAGFSLAAVSEGFGFVFRTPIIFGSALLDFFATFFSSATVLLPVFAAEILHTGPTGLGILYAASSLGSVVAGLCMPFLDFITQRGKLLLASVLLYGASTIGFGLSHTFALSFFFLFLAGAGDSVSTILRNTIRQVVTPDRLRGRMVAANMLFFMGGPQLGELEGGIAAAALGTAASVVLGGTGTIVAVLVIAWSIPVLRRYK